MIVNKISLTIKHFVTTLCIKHISSAKSWMNKKFLFLIS